MIIEENYLKMRDGIDLYCRYKEVGSNIWVIGVHGIAEHSGRQSFLPKLLGQDLNVLQYDLRGHGKSMGDIGKVSNFEDFSRDLEEVINFLKVHFRMKKFILFGHSVGALIVSEYLQKFSNDDNYPMKVILSSPPIGSLGFLKQVYQYQKKNILNTFMNLYKLKMVGLLDPRILSHDPRIYEDYKGDSLNNSGITYKLLLECLKASKEIYSKPLRVKCPGYCFIGGDDKIVSTESVLNYFQTIEKGFQVKVFDGAYHELHNEIDKFKLPYLEQLKSIFLRTVYQNMN